MLVGKKKTELRVGDAQSHGFDIVDTALTCQKRAGRQKGGGWGLSTAETSLAAMPLLAPHQHHLSVSKNFTPISVPFRFYLALPWLVLSRALPPSFPPGGGKLSKFHGCFWCCLALYMTDMCAYVRPVGANER